MVKHGRPDWVRATTLQDIRDVFGNIPQVGMGEMCARLGSIKHYDKRGEVVFMDNFEDSTLKWQVAGTGTGNTQLRSNVTARSGNFSLKLTTGDSVFDTAYAYRYGPEQVKKRIGFEYSFALSPNILYFYNTIKMYDGTNEFIMSFVYIPTDKKLYVIDEKGDSQEIASNVNLKEDDFLFHTWKQVADLETEKYIRCFLDNVEYDVSEYDIEKNLDNQAPHTYCYIAVITVTAANNYVYIDDVILTQNEP